MLPDKSNPVILLIRQTAIIDEPGRQLSRSSVRSFIVSSASRYLISVFQLFSQIFVLSTLNVIVFSVFKGIGLPGFALKKQTENYSAISGFQLIQFFPVTR